MLNLTAKIVPDGDDSPEVIIPCSEMHYYAKKQLIHLSGTDDAVGFAEITAGHVYMMNANGATVGNYHLTPPSGK